MDINKVKVLIQAVENGSLLATATKLGYTQAGLSHMMRSLESELGVTLLQRGKFGVKLTDEGKRLLPLFRELAVIDKKLETEVELILEQKASVIRVAAIASVIRTWLPDAMVSFQKKYPEISFEIQESDGKMYQWLDQGTIDVCITSNMILRDDFIPLVRDEFFACLPKEYPLKAGEKFPLRQIEEEPFICSTCGNDYDVERLLSDYDIHPKKQNTYVDDNSVISMVSRGFGISLLPNLVLQNCHEDIKIAELDLPCYRMIGLLYGKSANTSPAVKKFVSFLKKWQFEM